MKILGFVVYLIIVCAGMYFAERLFGMGDLSLVMLYGWIVFGFGLYVKDLIAPDE